ncbi:phage tail tube protein, partial [Escherichia coli]|nr:phage tail tube protein [Escherichia coli]
MTTPNPLAKTKGAGTTFWMYTGKGDAFANPLSDTDWLRLAMVKDLQPGEMSKRAARTVLTGMCYSVGSATRQGEQFADPVYRPVGYDVKDIA